MLDTPHHTFDHKTPSITPFSALYLTARAGRSALKRFLNFRIKRRSTSDRSTILSRSLSPKHTHTNTHAHAHTHTHSHVRAHARARTHTHTPHRTHPHTYTSEGGGGRRRKYPNTEEKHNGTTGTKKQHLIEYCFMLDCVHA